MAGLQQSPPRKAEASSSRTLVRGITVLETVAAAPGGISVTEVSASTSLDKGTASRLLAALRELGYVRQRETDRQYVLGSRSLWLSQRYRAGQEDLTGVAGPFIGALRDLTHETVHLAIREGLSMVYVAQEQPDRQIRVQSAVGQRLPLHGTAMGRAILAVMPDDDRETLLRTIQLDVEQAGGTVDFDEIRNDVIQARLRGWAAVDRHDDVTRIAAAIVDQQDHPIAAISLSGPSYRIVEHVEELGSEVARTAREVSEALAR